MKIPICGGFGIRDGSESRNRCLVRVGPNPPSGGFVDGRSATQRLAQSFAGWSIGHNWSCTGNGNPLFRAQTPCLAILDNASSFSSNQPILLAYCVWCRYRGAHRSIYQPGTQRLESTAPSTWQREHHRRGDKIS